MWKASLWKERCHNWLGTCQISGEKDVTARWQVKEPLVRKRVKPIQLRVIQIKIIAEAMKIHLTIWEDEGKTGVYDCKHSQLGRKK